MTSSPVFLASRLREQGLRSNWHRISVAELASWRNEITGECFHETRRDRWLCFSELVEGDGCVEIEPAHARLPEHIAEVYWWNVSTKLCFVVPADDRNCGFHFGEWADWPMTWRRFCTGQTAFWLNTSNDDTFQEADVNVQCWSFIDGNFVQIDKARARLPEHRSDVAWFNSSTGCNVWVRWWSRHEGFGPVCAASCSPASQ